MKTSELTGAALDWAVAKCEGVDVNLDNLYDPPTSAGVVLRCGQDDGDDEYFYEPSTDWSQGGPIIESEIISVHPHSYQNKGLNKTNAVWIGQIGHAHSGMPKHHGPTPLIAAMRCYVASVLGDEVEIPEGL